MDVRAAMFFTDYPMMPDALSRVLEHSHIPSSRRLQPARATSSAGIL
jgi:hypothetical protein